MSVDVDSIAEQTPEQFDLPYAFAKKHGVLIDIDQPDLLLYVDPLNPQVLMEVQRNHPVTLQLKQVERPVFERLLAQQYDRSQSGEAVMQHIGEESDLLDIADSLPEPEDLLESEDDAPIIRLINALLAQAVKENASDIHIEAFETRMQVRMRVDGELREVLEPPRQLAPLIISRLKVMAKLDIAEKRVPQDGRISLRLAGRPVDVRLSTLPSGTSERVVMRLLDKQAGRLTLDNMGLPLSLQEQLRELIAKPHGILLVTGPTGSGKTTTLYAALSELNQSRRNILTVEDPIEYYIDGIGQTQVNAKVDMTFARGLRAILRQDPDVVMVGEIRDLETAEIAVQASLTGHMVFSTLHTNTATGAIARMKDIGVEPYLLSTSLVGVLAQRLVRVLCQHCKQPARVTPSMRDLLTAKHYPVDWDQVTIYEPNGCVKCHHNGFAGRTGIYELIVFDQAARQFVHDGASEAVLEMHFRRTHPNLREDGMRLVIEGMTSLDEVLRVSQEGG